MSVDKPTAIIIPPPRVEVRGGIGNRVITGWYHGSAEEKEKDYSCYIMHHATPRIVKRIGKIIRLQG